MPNLSVHPALLGAALVCFLFRRNDEEEKLLAQSPCRGHLAEEQW